MCVHGTRVPITKSEYQSLCDLHDEGTFMATFGLWHKTEKKWVKFQNGGPDLFDETCDAKLLHEGDIRAFASSGREYGGHGKARSKIRCFEGGRSKKGSNVQDDNCVEVEERLVRCTHLRREDGEEQKRGRWSTLVGLVGTHVPEEACARSEAAEDKCAGSEKKMSKD